MFLFISLELCTPKGLHQATHYGLRLSNVSYHRDRERVCWELDEEEDGVTKNQQSVGVNEMKNTV